MEEQDSFLKKGKNGIEEMIWEINVIESEKASWD